MDEHEEHEDHNSSPEAERWDEPAAPPVPVTEPVEDDAERDDEIYEDDMS
jgi:hypothetical protein